MPTCERCKKNFIEEEYSNHTCSPITTKVQEIGLDQMYGSCTNKNNDKVYIAKGLNGIMYRLVECHHNPPHTNTEETTFDNEVIRYNFERVLTQTNRPETRRITTHECNRAQQDALRLQTETCTKCKHLIDDHLKPLGKKGKYVCRDCGCKID